MAPAASARVTTEHELNLPVVALVVGDAPDALVGGAALDEVVEEEPHAAKRIAASRTITAPTTSGRSLIRPLDPIRGRGVWRAYCMRTVSVRRYELSRLGGLFGPSLVRPLEIQN